jgi:hypothetical protein
MSVDIPKRFIFLRVIRQSLHQHKVFEYVGVIASVKGVTVAKH